MKKINLKSDELTTNRERKRSSSTSLSLGIVLLLVSLGIFGALSFLNQRVKTEIEIVQNELSNLKRKLDSKEYVELYDFQGRLYEVEDLIKNKESQFELLEKIGAFTLPQTRFSSLDNSIKDGGVSEIKAVFFVPNHYILAQQIEAYSLMDGAVDINLSSSEQKNDQVQAALTFTVKQNK